ncbi:endonuclease HNH [Candidatus Termititenax aidoneus]|uniref:Endonuclease HNH n=1 Tax=Termititenax aidoneus TaxID=2218524 RepID=A0A388T9W4_TERA1|nr:endonuclease HNH [Candidatus Termititenax aidoneus]
MSKKRTYIDIKAQREGRILAGNKCEICGQGNCAGHHYIPRGLGGLSHPNNIVSVCQPCHKAIHKGKIEIENLDNL